MKNCLLADMGEVKIVCREVVSTGKLIVQGKKRVMHGEWQKHSLKTIKNM